MGNRIYWSQIYWDAKKERNGIPYFLFSSTIVKFDASLTVKHASATLHCVQIPAPDSFSCWPRLTSTARLMSAFGIIEDKVHSESQVGIAAVKAIRSPVKPDFILRPSLVKLTPVLMSHSSSPTFFYLTKKSIKIPFHWTRKQFRRPWSGPCRGCCPGTACWWRDCWLRWGRGAHKWAGAAWGHWQRREPANIRHD